MYAASSSTGFRLVRAQMRHSRPFLGAHYPCLESKKTRCVEIFNPHARHMSIFTELKEKITKEVNDNSELKEQVEQLRKQAGDLTGKAGKFKQSVHDAGAKASGAFANVQNSDTGKKSSETARKLADMGGEGLKGATERLQQAYSDGKQKVSEKTENSEYVNEGRRAAEGAAEELSGFRQRLMQQPQLRWLVENTESLRSGWGEAARELVHGPERRDINRVVRGANTEQEQQQQQQAEGGEAEEGEEQADPGVTALQVVKEQGSAWERVAERLKHTPIIQGIMGVGKTVASSPVGQGAAKVGQAFGDKVEDAREVWETSQNPIVYTLSSLADSVLSETDTGIALRELRRLDPTFVLEEWKEDVRETVLPDIMGCFLKGDANGLRRWLSDGAFSVVAASIRQRKADGLTMDPRVLAVDNVEVLAAKSESQSSPIVVLQFEVQQIDCIRNREGDIVEGDEDAIRNVYYAFAFQRDYDEKETALKWRVIEFSMLGSVPYH